MRNEVKSKQQDRQEDTSSSTLTRISEKARKKLSYVIAESPPQNKKTILPDKSPLCENPFPTHTFFKISEVDSISNEKVYEPYWNDYCAEINSRLSSRIETGFVDSDSKSLNILSKKMVENSWFSTETKQVPNPNLCPIFSRFLPYFLVESTDCEDMLVRSRKIRIYPTKDQKKIFDSWFDASRWVYNQVIERITVRGEDYRKSDWMDLAKEILSDVPEYHEKAPFQVKKIAVRDAIASLCENKKRVKRGLIEKFVMHFRSRKRNLQSCYIPKSAVKENGIYPRISGKNALKYSELLPQNFGDCRMIRQNSKYYILVPESVNRPDVSEIQARQVAIDPGIRTFTSIFGVTENSEVIGSLGRGVANRIYRLSLQMDRLISEKSNRSANRDQKRIQFVIDRVRKKIVHLIDELHWKIIRFLVDNFDVIYIGKLEISELVVKGMRKLNTKSVRKLLSLRHYRFRQRLKDKALECGKIVREVCEAWTSQTDSWTGNIIPNLGSKEHVKIDGVNVNRDINGARGIFLRALNEFRSLVTANETVVDSPEFIRIS